MKRGRPTKYSKQLLGCVTHYTKECETNQLFPTIEGFASYLKVGTRTLYDWEAQHPEFSQTMDELRDTQRHLLISNGLHGGYNTRFAMFLLKANHGMTEKEPLVNTSQNNYMNISPELLAEALKIVEQDEA
jgi:hypothetical protein